MSAPSSEEKHIEWPQKRDTGINWKRWIVITQGKTSNNGCEQTSKCERIIETFECATEDKVIAEWEMELVDLMSEPVVEMALVWVSTYDVLV